MRTRITVCALAALSLAACQKRGDVPSSAPAADAAAAPAAEAAYDGSTASRPLPAISVPQLAYIYKYALAAPPKEVRHLVSKHEAMCWAAGPTVCQVTGSNITEDGPDKISATLTLRAQPQWLRQFRMGLEDDTKAVGGRMTATDTSSDDLSRSIVDTEAALTAKTILRDRLQETLRTRSGKVKDFFEMEQQLAQVQGEIDATRSELAMMRTRVATSELRIDYRSEGVLAPNGAFAPIGAAAEDVVGIFVAVLAFLIRALAVVAPVAMLGGLAWWVTRTLQRRKAKAPAA
jgi:uncharacterized protein DUF4349